MNDIAYLYTVQEVASFLKVNKNVVYDLIKHGYMKGFKLGSMKVTKAELLKFLKENNGKDLSDLENIKDLEVKA